MEIHIHPALKLKEIQDEFHKRFPFLMLKFYSEKHKTGEGSHIEDLLPADKLLSDFSSSDFSWHITGLMTAGELENTFQEKTGIGVQVFHKSVEVWLQTINTDSKTLNELNAKGKEMNEVPLEGEPEDYHEHE